MKLKLVLTFETECDSDEVKMYKEAIKDGDMQLLCESFNCPDEPVDIKLLVPDTKKK